MSRTVHVDFRKWPDSIHWQFEMFHLGEDEWGTWLWAPPGSTARRGAEPPKQFRHRNVKLVVPGAWWTAIWNDGRSYDLYVDIITPPVWDGDTVTMIDLDLDVQRSLDGAVTILDEDEFAHHQELYGYPQEIVDGARVATDDVAARLRRREEPFVDTAATWMALASTLG